MPAAHKMNEKKEIAENSGSGGVATQKSKLNSPPVAIPVTPEADDHPLAGGLLPFQTLKGRQKFVSKVFTVVLIMLSICAFGAFFPHFFPGHWSKTKSGWVERPHPVKAFFQDWWWLSIFPSVVFFITHCLMVCIDSFRRQFPKNIITLTILAISAALMLPFASAYHNFIGVAIAVAATALLCLAIIIYAKFTSFDFTTKGFYILCFACGVTLFTIVVSLFLFMVPHVNYTLGLFLHLLISLLSVVMFSLYLAYDVQLVLGGRRFQIREDEWILGAVKIFTDIFGLFFSMLGLTQRV
ncbi:hypothetical protein QR680_010021 [Steinernema hermaphroditum]|uniref:Uncharacterized protein n=1 Tax=Steinernema hermaphroditum TaxID=289476 RepID=A0AA39IP39_9BILA|nr:hypothetical protein QR680_010021 [Steinernema hermaphroditum]